MPGEKRTVMVIAITATMMVVEIGAGLSLGSMALLADGLHMASHTIALAIAAFAYVYARKHAHDQRFSFGTGKVNSLGGFSGAILLGVFAVMMAWESIDRFFNPVLIEFDWAIIVAFLGLLVNGVSAVILGRPQQRDDDHHPDHHHHHARDDHNLRSAYLHVLADALTSVLAICALLAGKFYGLNWMDPGMGIVGSILVARWSFGLVRTTSCVLLDRQGPENILAAVRNAVEATDDIQVSDLHVWSIGVGKYAAIICVTASEPTSADRCKERIPEGLGLVHVTVEVNQGSRNSDHFSGREMPAAESPEQPGPDRPL